MKLSQTSKIIQKANKNYLAFGAFAVFILLFYGNTLLNGFVLDDVPVVENNPYLRSFEYLPKVVTGCLWEYSNKGCEGRTFYYRPIHSLSAFLTWQISSSPWFFHAVNLGYFFLLGVLVFSFAKLLLKNSLSAFFAALVFLIHPFNTEVVNWVSAVPELTMTIFILLAGILYIQYRNTGQLRNFVFVGILYFLAMLAKEPGVLLPLLLLAIDICVLRLPIGKLLSKRELLRYVSLGVPLAVYFTMRLTVLGALVGGGFLKFTLAERIYAFFELFAQYAQKMVYPVHLSAFYRFQIKSDFFSIEFLFSFLVVLGFGLLLFVAFAKKKYVIAFSLFWFFLFLSPVLLFVDAIGENVFSERYAFLPGVGIALLAGHSLGFAWREKSERARKGIAVLLMCVVFSSWYVVFQRNLLWKDNETLYTATLKQNPDALGFRRDLGMVYLRQGRLEDARKEFEELINRAPDWKDITMAYKGLGDYYKLRGDEGKTLEYYVKATASSFSPRDYVVYNDVGVLYMDRGEYLKGFSYFCRSLQLLPENTATQQNFDSSLSAIEAEYMKKGTLYEKVQEQFVKAPEQKIAFLDKKCQEKTCQYAFAFRGDQQIEVLPPFLIAAQTQIGKDMTILNKGFDQAAGVIVLEVSSDFQDKAMTVVFPSCNGIYYEASTN